VTSETVSTSDSAWVRPLRERLKVVEALLAWADDSAAQREETRAMLRQLLADFAEEARVRTTALTDASGVQRRWAKSSAALDEAGGERRAVAALRDAMTSAAARPRVRRRFNFRWVEATILAVVLLAIGSMVLPALLYPMNATRLTDLARLSRALDLYRADTGGYPISLNAGGGNDWVGIGWNGIGEDWLPGLVPAYIDKLPRDPRNTDIQHAQYAYFSDGKDYKLLSFNPEGCSLIVLLRPWLNDPVRNTGGSCQAYGVSTPGGQQW
jgi:hypothetical protein